MLQICFLVLFLTAHFPKKQVTVAFDDEWVDYAYMCSLKDSVGNALLALDAIGVLPTWEGKHAASFVVAVAVRALFQHPRPIRGTTGSLAGALSRSMSWLLHLGNWGLDTANVPFNVIREQLSFSLGECAAIRAAMTQFQAQLQAVMVPPQGPPANTKAFLTLQNFWEVEFSGGSPGQPKLYWQVYRDRVSQFATGAPLFTLDV